MENTLFEQVQRISCKYAGLIEKRIDLALSGETEPEDAMERINEGIRRLGYLSAITEKAKGGKQQHLEGMRITKGMTQEDVAKAAGISRPAYCNIEKGVRRPSPEVAQKIAKELGFDWTLFFTGHINKRN